MGKEHLYVVFRILVGLLFLQHGLQKIFGFFGAQSVELFTLFGLAGIIELVGGLFIILGLYTRIAATISALNMLFAYFIVHIGKGLIPITNGGELALLFFASFLVLMLYGSKHCSMDNFFLPKHVKSHTPHHVDEKHH